MARLRSADNEVRRADVAERCIIIRPSSVVVAHRWTLLNDTAKSTSRKSVARQIDTSTVQLRLATFSPSRPSSSRRRQPSRTPSRVHRRPALGVSISISRMPITRRRSWATSTIKRFIIVADRSSTSNRIQIVVRLTLPSIGRQGRTGPASCRPSRALSPDRSHH